MIITGAGLDSLVQPQGVLMKIKSIVVGFATACFFLSTHAQTSEIKTNKNSIQVIDKKIRAMYPNTKFTDIRPSVLPGLVEIVMGQNIAYTDSQARYFIFGRVFDMKEQVDLTAQRLKEQRANQRVKYPASFLNNAIKTVKGDGSRQLVVFSDPNCPYCKNLERELAKLDNLTVYTFIYPVLGDDSKTLAIATWCAPDKSAAWRDLMLRQIRSILTSCVTPINENVTLGTQLGVTGTPTLIASDGRVLHGAASAEKINEWLGEGR
jgi:thiol:disulfide interchange protein DsbC